MSNCPEIRPLLGGYFDGELSEAQREQVADHVTRCADCSAELEDFARLDALVRDSAVPQASEEEWAGVWANVRRELPAAPRPHAWLRAAGPLAAAAVVLIAVGLGIILSQPATVLADQAWEVNDIEPLSPDVAVWHHYDRDADVTVIQVLYAPEENGVPNHDGST